MTSSENAAAKLDITGNKTYGKNMQTDWNLPGTFLSNIGGLSGVPNHVALSRCSSPAPLHVLRLRGSAVVAGAAKPRTTERHLF
jgi:hypothetical protein